MLLIGIDSVRSLASLRRQASRHRIGYGHDTAIQISLEVVAGGVDAAGAIDRTQVLQVHRVDILANLDCLLVVRVMMLHNLIGAQLLGDHLVCLQADRARVDSVASPTLNAREDLRLVRSRVSLERPMPTILVTVFLSNFGATVGSLHPDSITMVVH